MNKEQAKQILTGNACEGTKAEREEARAFVAREGDSLLDEIHAERKFDASFRNYCAAIPVPDGLRDSILRDQFRASGARSGKNVLMNSNVESAPERMARPRHRQIAWVYAAAAAVVALLLIRIPMGEPSGVAGEAVAVTSTARASVGDFVTSIANHFPKIGPYHQRSSDFDVLGSYLTAHGSPIEIPLAERFAAVRPEGCRILEIDGVRVSMICMSGDLFMHLFVAPASVCGNAEFDDVLDFEKGGRAFIAWREGENLYVIAARSELETLRTHLQPTFASAR